MPLDYIIRYLQFIFYRLGCSGFEQKRLPGFFGEVEMVATGMRANQVLMLKHCRCATGEAWPSIMLSCIKGRPCDPVAKKAGPECGSNLAYAYFVSFIFFCSFLVSFTAVCLSHFQGRERDVYVIVLCSVFFMNQSLFLMNTKVASHG